MHIIKAQLQQLDEVAQLFDLYRQFYECEADIDLARHFISERISNNESIIFVAIEGDKAKGFVQLYPSFCSVDTVKIYILYDLYVDKSARKMGLGRQLMNKASDFAKNSGASRVDLLTAFSNKAGQHLYENLSYKIVNDKFHAYSLKL